ncbi:MAG: hypothetical protein IRY94_19805, partial [Rhodospirillaceae bacterium]|nr:hypothetical protein [Rhodospirillaceae bacterium]
GGGPLMPTPGGPPDLAAPPPGCRFHPRCAHAEAPCREAPPDLEPVGEGHASACIRRELFA